MIKQTIWLWAISIISGLLFIFIINGPLSSISSLIMPHVSLSFGWKQPPTHVYRNCTVNEYFSENNTGCMPMCTMEAISYGNGAYSGGGLPFTTYRAGKESTCGELAQNNFASLLNYLFGVFIGIATALIVSRVWKIKNNRKKNIVLGIYSAFIFVVIIGIITLYWSYLI